MVAQTNHQQTNYAAENKWHGDLFTNGEKPISKNPTRWFLGHHSRNSPIITTSGYKQGIPSTLPTYSWTLISIPNRTCSVLTVPLSDARLLSTWLTVARIPVRDFKTPIWKDCWLQSSPVHPHDEDQEDAWSQNPMVQIHSNFFKGRDELGQEPCLRSQFAWIEFAQCLCNLCIVWWLLKQYFYIFRVRSK